MGCCCWLEGRLYAVNSSETGPTDTLLGDAALGQDLGFPTACASTKEGEMVDVLIQVEAV